MISFAIYRLTTGEITQLGSATGMTVDMLLEHWPVPAGQEIKVLVEPLASNLTHLIIDGVPVERAVIDPAVSQMTIAADGEDACVISGLPEDCRVMISGAIRHGPIMLTGGVLEITCSTPGAIVITASKNPTHLMWETTIHAA